MSRCQVRAKLRSVDRRTISLSTHVDITESNAKYGPMRPRIAISKFWLGKGGQVNLTEQDQWLKIVDAVTELGQLIGWKATTSARPTPSRPPVPPTKAGALSEAIAREVDLESIPKDDYQRFIAVIRATSDVFAKADDAYAGAFAKVVSRLPSQRAQALGELGRASGIVVPSTDYRGQQRGEISTRHTGLVQESGRE